MNGGQTDTYGVPHASGRRDHRPLAAADFDERQGRFGLTLYMFTETEWTNQNGASSSAAASPPRSATEGAAP